MNEDHYIFLQESPLMPDQEVQLLFLLSHCSQRRRCSACRRSVADNIGSSRLIEMCIQVFKITPSEVLTTLYKEFASTLPNSPSGV